MSNSIQSFTISDHVRTPLERREEFETNLRLELQALGMGEAEIETIVTASKTAVTFQNAYRID